MEFAPGDVVELKSGGPLLTVVTATAEKVSCIWFEETVGEFRTHEFAPVLLSKAELEGEEEDEDEEDEDEDER
ncbi:DUF2158 domain-containing protein [Starkeya sp. ORNL1]|jgi:uncharacterized protein YodC (DUF2158 family)|uniref:YodC family protein n=1 Tax=Starkeya sp. ORNL1 TaxID=2709380 RepID=UPI001463C257|nr:DUF2158 domain-containing protein [Starkeya sp. ORNL1]QJP17158.1 DUF2158 domain-containing protein [Starkeya sp. ORNL1]